MLAGVVTTSASRPSASSARRTRRCRAARTSDRADEGHVPQPGPTAMPRARRAGLDRRRRWSHALRARRWRGRSELLGGRELAPAARTVTSGVRRRARALLAAGSQRRRRSRQLLARLRSAARRCSMSASSRTAVRLSGAALRTYSNSVAASSYLRHLQQGAAERDARREIGGMLCQTGPADANGSSNSPARRCSSASCAKAIDAGSFWIRRRSSSIRGLSGTRPYGTTMWPRRGRRPVPGCRSRST